ncbi:MAG: DUF1015 domain-containing protein [Dehalococcoidia bacterium]|nr:DUF1015 domain-containing protein [Dehalococcoidia bacterium]
MPQFLPFRGLRYTERAGVLGDLLAPPYDVISPEQQRELAQRSPYNAVHLELAEGGDERYERVAGLLREWEEQGILQRDAEPMLYVYEQAFDIHGQEFRRRAVLAAVEAQPWEAGVVKPHEFTLSGPKEDRLRLLEATKVQLSPVFMIARDRADQLRHFLDQTIQSRPADVEATSSDGDRHRLWVVEAGRYELRQLAPILAESLYIADGHHRYETAVNYRNRLLEREGRLEHDHPARYAMAAIVPATDPGLVVRPIHRIVPRQAPANWAERLHDNFAIEEVKLAGADHVEAEALLTRLADEPSGIVALNLKPGMVHILKPRDESVFERIAPSGHTGDWVRVGPNLLRYGVLNPLWDISDEDLRQGAVEFDHEAGPTLSRVMSSANTTGFLLNAVTVHQVIDLADAGERLPQKSTFFHPKLGTGLVLNPLYP